MHRVVAVLFLAFSATLHAQSRHRAVSPIAAPPFKILAEESVGQLRLGPSDAGNGAARVATSGDETLVVWGHGVQYQTSTIEYAFIGDPLPRTLPSSSESPFLQLVFDGTDYIVMAGETLYRIDRSGRVLSRQVLDGLLAVGSDRRTLAYVLYNDFIAGDIRTHLSDDDLEAPHIVTNGNGYLAIWSDLGADMAEPFASDGTPLAPPVATGLTGYTLTAVWTGRDYLVLDNQNWNVTGDDEIRGVHVGVDGSVGKPATIVRGKVLAMQAASDGTTINLAWTDETAGATYAVRIVGDAVTAPVLLDPGNGLTINTDALPALTAFNGKFAAAQTRPGHLGVLGQQGSDVYALTFTSSELLSAGLLAVRGVRMSTQAPAQLEPAVAANAAARAIVWREADAIWMSIDGGAATPVSPSAATQVTPSIATNGVDFFVAWAEGSDVRVARVDVRGRASPAVTVGSGSHPVIVCGAADCAVLFMVTTNITSDLGVRRVSFNGVALDDAPLTSVFGPNAYALEATIGWTGRHYLAVWRGRRGVVFAADVDRSGFTNMRTIGGGDNVRVASNGNDTVVVWGGGGVRINAAGNVVEQLEVDGVDPSVAWTGREFIVVFIPDDLDLGATSTKLFATRIGIDHAPIVVDANVAAFFTGSDAVPTLASRGDGTATVAYTRLRTEAPYMGCLRLFARTIGE